MNESSTTYDCSIKDTVHISLPSMELFDGLKLKHGENPGEYIDASGQIIAQDPSIQNGGLNCLLIRKDKMINFLNKKRMTLM